ncbi:MAG TPA: hypothetical protein IAA49_04235 [Candidatus Alistipes pullicola]|nr:hypothetical protein [Candidatus Alistipes pullicola]
MKKQLLLFLLSFGAFFVHGMPPETVLPGLADDTVSKQINPIPLVSADSLALPQQPLSASDKKPFLPTRRRMDREIDKNKFAYKGEVAIGLTASYGTLSSEETDYLLILDNLNLDGSIFTVNPSFGYFIKDNLCVGVRFGYTRMQGHVGSANINLGEANDINMSFANIRLDNHTVSYGAFFRSYAGIDSKGHFGLFSEMEIAVNTGSTNLAYESNAQMKHTHSENLQCKLDFNPGLAVYVFPNVCTTISFGLGGIQYTKTTQKDPEGNVIGSRSASKMRFRLNLLNIRIGFNVHL